MSNADERVRPIFLEFRKAIDEYVASVRDTTKPLHNRGDCRPTKPCALCRRRTKAENQLLALVGRKPVPAWIAELGEWIAAAEALKPKLKM